MSTSKGTRSNAGQPRFLKVRRLGIVEYEDAWRTMRAITDGRDGHTPDELWFLQHPAVFTLGQAGRREHVLSAGQIPVVASDRGGQVTYHAPGQLVTYILLDLKRARLGVKRLVGTIEQAVIDLLKSAGLPAARRAGAPGVYVNGEKIAALGLRVRNGCSYHGLALNVDLDLEPFARINPCGIPGLKVTSLRQHAVSWSIVQTEDRLLSILARLLEFDPLSIVEKPGGVPDDTPAIGDSTEENSRELKAGVVR